MEIISVNITKGGCGKTTTVQVMAELLSTKYSKKVLCIDTDPQCNLTTVSGINIMDCQKHNLYTLLKGDSTIQECIKSCKYYDLVPGSLLLAYADTEFHSLGREYLLKEKFDSISYDVVLIDTPPSLGILNIMSLTASSKIIMPCEASYLAMIGLEQLYQTILSVKKHSNTNLKVLGVLMAKYSAKANINVAILNGLKKLADDMNTIVFESKIRETVKVKEAQSQMEPIIDWDSKCTAVEDYESLAKEIIPFLDI